MSNINSFIIEHYKSLDDLEDDFRNKNLNNLVASKVTGDSILDIGCGTGHLMNILLKQGKTVVGIEPIKELVTLAKEKNPYLNIIEYMAEDITKIDKKFSTITAIDVIEHIKDDTEIILKLKENLHENGYLILIAPAFPMLYGKRDTSLGHYRRYAKSDLIKKIKTSNLSIKEIRYWNMIGFMPYLFSQKLFNSLGIITLRTNKNKNIIERGCIKILDLWYKYIENNVNLGFGLSLICIAQKKK